VITTSSASTPKGKAAAKNKASPNAASDKISPAALDRQLKTLLSLDLTTMENVTKIKAKMEKHPTKWQWATSFLHSINNQEKKRDEVKAG
jgi:hypothetical protein